MSAIPQKRTNAGATGLSALCQIQTCDREHQVSEDMGAERPWVTDLGTFVFNQTGFLRSHEVKDVLVPIDPNAAIGEVRPATAACSRYLPQGQRPLRPALVL